MEPIDIRVPRDWREAQLETGLCEWLTPRADHVYRQYRLRSGRRPDIAAISRRGAQPAFTIIEVKLYYTATWGAVKQLFNYVDEVADALRDDPEEWMLSGFLASPGIKFGVEDWPSWFGYMPLRITEF